jgi:hypothetical protein
MFFHSLSGGETMKTARTSQTQMPADGLPPVPDYPDSPLSGWKHYGIMKLAEKMIHDELEGLNYGGKLVGLRISYFVGGSDNPEKQEDLGDEHQMAFGYNVEDDGPDTIEEAPPPSEEFINGLYDFVSDMIANNISPYVLGFSVRLDTAFNQIPTKYTIACRFVGQNECTQGHTGVFRMISINHGPWRCLHRPC